MTQSLLLLATVIVVTAIVMAVFLIFRWLAEAVRRQKSLEETQFEGSILAEQQDRDASQSWAEDIDRGFRSMVRQTGIIWTPGFVLAAMASWAVFACGLVYLLSENLALVAMALVAAVFLPLSVLYALHARWRNKVQHQLPDVFFLLARSLRAGLTLDQALQTASQSGPLPLAKELHPAVEQCKLGLAVTAALQSVAHRLKMVDFDAFVMTVSLHRNVGGNLSHLLDRLATSVRDRNLFRGYFKSATALGRVTAIFLAIAAPVLLMGSFFLQPELMGHFTAAASGWRMLAVAGGLELLGCVWLYRVLRIDY